jgi:hypothetical protein
MLGKQKQVLKELKLKRDSFKWDIEEIKHSDMDPDRKAMHISDVEYEYYMLDLKIDLIEHEIAMIPLKVMTAAFIVSAAFLVIYVLIKS